jgi:CheY-like chemotaxis protein
VKFTPEGGHVAIDVAALNGSVAVRVADTGAGIDPSFLPHVFDRFRQGDSTTTRSVGGLGLGLFIARHLVEAQEGTIKAASDGRDKGATFTVTLKPAPGAARALVPALPEYPTGRERREVKPTLTGVRVLVVDDEADSREMMTSALETCGATVVAAASAKEALRALSRGHVDVLLSDIAMPDKDGYELIREVRLAPTARIATVPAAAVTACVREDEKRKVIQEGFQMHLAKPVHPTALANAVAALARRLPN